SLKFELKMYDIKNLKNEDGITLEKDLKPENEPNRDKQELSYRKFSSIHNDTKLPFTEMQYDCIKNVPKPILRWSVAVSDKSTNSSKFKLLAISCISLKDMKYYEKIMIK
ncbi:38744_t:CDS:1, partial [Gigaspora margarita]